MSASFSSRLSHAQRLHASGKLREAEALFSTLLKEFGADPMAVARLGDAAFDMGETEAAMALYRRAISTAPHDASILGRFGTLLARAGRKGEALDFLRRAVALAPSDARLRYNLGKALAEEMLTEQAAQAYRQATELDAKFTWAFTNLGNALADLGRHEEAAESYRRSLELEPSNSECWSNFLLSSQYAQDVTPAKLFELSQGFEKNVGKALRKHSRPNDNRRALGRPLRIGYVSPDFKRHPVGYFMQGVFANHDRKNFEVFAYSCHPKEDELTAELKGHSKAWIPAFQLDDRALAQRIRSDRIDILVDLAGHTGGNRLPVFAMKPAPLQIAWCGYVGTTGLKAMDALIADRFHIPANEESFYVEKILRLPDSWLCFTPPTYAPPVQEPPLNRTGHVTFGCFNNPAKISASAIRLWQRLLDAVPNSRLVLRAAFFTGQERIDIYRRRFKEVGADITRFDFLPALPHKELLASYGDIDIALDPFPYCGGITTLEALWMGVPVVTKTGGTFPGRHSTSFLTTAGLAEFIASDNEAYLALAVGLANDANRLSALRKEMRGRLAASPLLDHKGFTRHYEALLQGLWRG